MSETYTDSPDSNKPLARSYSDVALEFEPYILDVPMIGGLTVRPYLAKLAFETMRTVTAEAANNGGGVRLTYDSLSDGGSVGIELEPPIELLNQTDLDSLRAAAELAGGSLVQHTDDKNGSNKIARVALSFPFHFDPK